MIYDYEQIAPLLEGLIKVRKDKVILKTEKGVYTIPSKILPLQNSKSIKFFYEGNTEPLRSSDSNYKKIKSAFNSTEMSLGDCFNNVLKLKENIIKQSVDPNLLETYVGWTFIPLDIPIAHCCLVYDKNKILDYSISKKTKLLELSQKKCDSLSTQEMREIVINQSIEEANLPSHKVKTFGQLKYPYLFVGSHTDIHQSFSMLRDLLKENPNHLFLGSCNKKTSIQKEVFAKTNK